MPALARFLLCYSLFPQVDDVDHIVTFSLSTIGGLQSVLDDEALGRSALDSLSHLYVNDGSVGSDVLQAAGKWKAGEGALASSIAALPGLFQGLDNLVK